MRVSSLPARNKKPGRPVRGFTLVEMLVVLTVVGILAAIAVPSFYGITVDQRVRAGASALQDSLWFARSEAIKRNRSVYFTVASLESGWSVMLRDGSNTVLRTQQGFPGLVATFSSGSSVTFEYNAFGRLGPGATATRITVRDTDGRYGRCISFDAAARAQVSWGACP